MLHCPQESLQPVPLDTESMGVLPRLLVSRQPRCQTDKLHEVDLLSPTKKEAKLTKQSEPIRGILGSTTTEDKSKVRLVFLAQADGRTHPDADVSPIRGVSAAVRRQARKPTPWVTKANLADALDFEPHEDTTGATTEAPWEKMASNERKASSHVGLSFSALFGRRRFKRQGTGFVNQNRLRQVLQLYGEDTDSADEAEKAGEPQLGS